MGESRFQLTETEIGERLIASNRVLVEIQGRITEARKYVEKHSGDPRLLAILNGATSSSKRPEADG